MNTPYKKQYKDGVLVNPIEGSYKSQLPNRSLRRSKFQKDRFMNNSKSFPLVISGGLKYKKVLEIRKDKEGKLIRIEHYLISK